MAIALWHWLGMASPSDGSPWRALLDGQTEQVSIQGHENLIFYDIWISWLAQGHSPIQMSCRCWVGTSPWQGCAHSTMIRCFFGFSIYWYLEDPDKV